MPKDVLITSMSSAHATIPHILGLTLFISKHKNLGRKHFRLLGRNLNFEAIGATKLIAPFVKYEIKMTPGQLALHYNERNHGTLYFISLTN